MAVKRSPPPSWRKMVLLWTILKNISLIRAEYRYITPKFALSLTWGHHRSVAYDTARTSHHRPFLEDESLHRALSARGGAAGATSAAGVAAALTYSSSSAKVTFARTVTSLNLFTSLFGYLIPDRVVQAGNIRNSPLVQVVMRRQGAMLLSHALLAASHSFFYRQRISLSTAVAVSTVPLVIEWARSEFAGEPQRDGWPPYRQWFPVVAVSILTAACIQHWTWSQRAIQVYAVALFLNGVQVAWFPNWARRFRGIYYELNVFESFTFKYWGYMCMNVSVYVGLLAFGVVLDPLRALGLSWGPSLLGKVVDTLLTAKARSIGFNLSPLLAWTLIHFVSVVFLGLASI